MKKLITKSLVSAAKKLDKKVVNALTARANKKAGVAGTTAKRSTAARKANKAAQAQVKKASKLFSKNPQARASAVKKAKARAKASSARLKRREAARKTGLANQRAAKKTAKKIYKGTAAAAGATAVGGGVAASRAGSKPKAQAPKPKPKPAPKSKTTGKAFNVAALRSAYNKATTPKPKKPLGPENKPAKKTAKIASVPTVKNPRTPTTGPKTKVPVGSSIIRNKDGSIKKINKPSGKAPKNKFDRMTTSQLNRLSGREAAAYRKYKKEKGKK
jgi:hypothetical protein|tara:strand:+ start:608 stop:1426 length:819 start_codon:yes stop_codon:yes gene_type:complete